MEGWWREQNLKVDQVYDWIHKVVDKNEINHPLTIQTTSPTKNA